MLLLSKTFPPSQEQACAVWGEMTGGSLLHPRKGAAVLGSAGSRSWWEPVSLRRPARSRTGSDAQVPRS